MPLPPMLSLSKLASHSLRRGGNDHNREAGLSEEERCVLGRWAFHLTQRKYVDWTLERLVALHKRT